MIGWKKIPLGDAITLQRGYDLPCQLRRHGVVPVISSAGTSDWHDNAMVTPPGVVTGRYGTIGKLFFIQEPFWPLNTTLYVKNFHGNEPKYIYYLLQLFDFNIFSGKSGVPGVNRNDIHAELVCIPNSIEEQQAIVAVLSDADALIDALEQGIAKKRHIKQGAMQELLTGKRRLPGFWGESQGYKLTEVGEIPDDWEVKKIETVIHDISMGPFGSDIKVTNFVSHGVPVLNGFNLRSMKLTDVFTNFVTEEKAYSLKKAVAVRGDVIVTHRGTLGQISYIPKDSSFEKYVISQSQFRVQFDIQRVAPSWIVMFFRSDIGARTLLEGKGHTGVPALAQPTTKFRQLFIPLPPTKEQAAIAAVLTDMDEEIAALEAKLSKARQIKAGMMQELLTGRIRLV